MTGVILGATSLGDINGDGHLDIVITGEDSNLNPSATVYLGDGTGGFTEAGAGLTGVAYVKSNPLGDINGDGHLDLVMTGSDGSNPTATVYLGDGTGGFTEAGAGLTGVTNSFASLGDIDGDGDLDLVVTGDDFLFGGPSARLYVNRFVQESPNRPPTLSVPPESFSVAPGRTKNQLVQAGDLDGDQLSFSLAQSAPGASITDAGNGIAEITFSATRAQAGETFSLTLEVSDGSGATVTKSIQIEVGNTYAGLNAGLTGVSRSSTSFGDINGDGHLDLVVTGEDSDDNATTTVYLGDGTGGFAEAGASLTGVGYGSSTSLGDLNGDGQLDLVIAGMDSDLDPTATVYLGDGTGGFTEAGAGLTGVGFGSSTSLGDLNGDGHLDLVVTGGVSGNNTPTTVYLGDGTGGFTEANAGLTGVEYGSSTSLGDLDGDGHLDLVLTGQVSDDNATTTVYLGDGTGGFTEAGAGLTGVYSSSTSLGDINADGHTDLVVTGSKGDSVPMRIATVYLGDGTGGFTNSGAGLTGVYSGSTSLGDINADGHTDLVVTGTDGSSPKAMVYLGDGTGGFTKAGAGLNGVDLSSTSLGDIDGDGTLDLVVTGQGKNGPTAAAYENLLASDFRVASTTQSVSQDGPASFVGTGISVRFSGTSGSGDVVAQRFSNRPSNPLGISNPPGPGATSVSSYRFVLSAGSDLTFSDNTEVRLNVSDFAGIGAQVYRRLPRSNSLFRPLPTNYHPSTGQLVAETGALGEFALASGDASNPLPVELASFGADVSGSTAMLTWQTVSETRNAGFAVQHRPDSTAAWTELGFVDSKAGDGTPDEPRQYRYRAENLDVGTHQFQLKQVDTDGTTHFSKPIQAQVRMEETYRLRAYPNPTVGQATVELAVQKGQDLTLRLYDALGRQVATLFRGQVSPQETTIVSLPGRDLGLSSGTYFLRLIGEQGTRTAQITVAR